MDSASSNAMAMHRQSSPRHLPNWRMTQRDMAIVGEVLRWQQLTTQQIARWFFESPRTTTNRIAILLQLGYLKTIQIPWRAPALVTATAKGARARADLGLRARASEPGRLLHDLTVVEVAAWMLEQDPQAGWITERELLRDELTAARDPAGRLRRGPGRRPDGVLVRMNRREEAVEVELTPKRDRTEYDRKLNWYLGQMHYQRVHWFAPSFSLRERLWRVVPELNMGNLVDVSPLPDGRDNPPGVKPDRRPGAATSVWVYRSRGRQSTRASASPPLRSFLAPLRPSG
jgi:hypothetical protein